MMACIASAADSHYDGRMHRPITPFAALWIACLTLLASPAAHALVPADTARQVAQGLAKLDPWMPALLAAWVALGAWCWVLAIRPLRAKQLLREQLGAPAPEAPRLPFTPLIVAALCLMAVVQIGRAVLIPSQAGHGLLLGWDQAAQLWSQQHVSPEWRSRLQYVTDTGDVLWLGVLSVLVAVFLAARRLWLPLQIWVFAIGLNGLSTRVLKNAFNRARPEVVHDIVTSGASFPSGHTAGSIVVYGLLWWLLRPWISPRKRRWLGLGLVALVLLIAASRIWLQAHFVSDVLAGGLMGLAVLGLAVWALERGRALN